MITCRAHSICFYFLRQWATVIVEAVTVATVVTVTVEIVTVAGTVLVTFVKF